MRSPSTIFAQGRHIFTTPIASRWAGGRSRREFLALAGIIGAGCARGRAVAADAAVLEAPAGWSARSWDGFRRALRAIVAVRDVEGPHGIILHREVSAGERLPAGALAFVVSLVAGLRGDLLRWDDRFVCDGTRCERSHGRMRPSDALAWGCRGYFTALAPRLGTVMIASAFAALGMTSPPVPDDLEARVRFALRGEGWRLGVEDAIALARGLRSLATSDPGAWSEALIPRHGDPGPLRGVVAADEGAAWFVGYSTGPSARAVIAHVADCAERPGVSALGAARLALAESAQRPLPTRARTLRSDTSF